MTRHSSSSSSPDENRRLRSTLKEKKRNIEINEAFERLQKQLPHVPTSTRLPKIKTLRLALKYIEHLKTILSGDKQIMSDYMSSPRPLCIEDFAAVAMQEIQIRNSYTDRARSEEGISGVRATSSSPFHELPKPKSPTRQPYMPVPVRSESPSHTHYTPLSSTTIQSSTYLQPTYLPYQQNYYWPSQQ
ncbi:Helix-loop-helix DNA-binding domain protein [Dictyocaulus viviparus]|uniref:Helix-loop-helix DNA-binding domain protein n=1 Tax=Dictyocaulus viviparus TaxID=29172 RepID=A0A0D8XM13_DICVI|nr:Helix-loop-helix DNA-binding domain protein [Dictyocaulus viviparus]